MHAASKFGVYCVLIIAFCVLSITCPPPANHNHHQGGTNNHQQNHQVGGGETGHNAAGNGHTAQHINGVNGGAGHTGAGQTGAAGAGNNGGATGHNGAVPGHTAGGTGGGGAGHPPAHQTGETIAERRARGARNGLQGHGLNLSAPGESRHHYGDAHHQSPGHHDRQTPSSRSSTPSLGGSSASADSDYFMPETPPSRRDRLMYVSADDAQNDL